MSFERLGFTRLLPATYSRAREAQPRDGGAALHAQRAARRHALAWLSATLATAGATQGVPVPPAPPDVGLVNAPASCSTLAP
jgi:hypothetical protein